MEELQPVPGAYVPVIKMKVYCVCVCVVTVDVPVVWLRCI